MAIDLYDYQVEAIRNMKSGSVLCGGVGSGKSRTALAYYVLLSCKGEVKVRVYSDGKACGSEWKRFKLMKEPRDLYIITTAKKRDSMEWQMECAKFGLFDEEQYDEPNAFGVKVSIDSWNNIKKYRKINGAFFIFDEQRVIGSGAWVKAFLDIARKNNWVLLSATPGDTWSDYVPVFIANGFFKNRTEFNAKHCVFSRFSKYPKIERYIYEDDLIDFRDSILVKMYDPRKTVRHDIVVKVSYDKAKLRLVTGGHWDVFNNCPIQEAGKWVYLMRRVVNSDESRIKALDELIADHHRIILFYNFNYELDMITTWLDGFFYHYKQWNGRVHEECPKGESWVYLVQYTAGSEGWNCTTTDTIVFFSQNYSYKIMEQASGRIDRINTPYTDLYYYHLKSNAPIDLAIAKALREKRNFSESSFCRRRMKDG